MTTKEKENVPTQQDNKNDITTNDDNKNNKEHLMEQNEVDDADGDEELVVPLVAAVENEDQQQQQSDDEEADHQQGRLSSTTVVPDIVHPATTSAKTNNNTAAAPTAQQQQQRPIKRARTAYFIFADEKRLQLQKEHPGEGVAVIAKLMGQSWSSLDVEQKQIYQLKAAQERERVSKELEAWNKQQQHQESDHTVIPSSSNPTALKPGIQGRRGIGSTTTTAAATTTLYPISKIRKICKLDPEVRGLSKEATLLITKAAELCTISLGKECVRMAQIQNRRKLVPDDLVQVCHTREQFVFLREDIQDLTITQQQQQQQQQDKNKQQNKGQQQKEVKSKNHRHHPKEISNKDSNMKVPPAGTKPLTAYFNSSSK